MDLYKKLENAIFHINEKTKQNGITIGDSLILLTFEITKMELMELKKISDNTLRALNEIGSRTAHLYYYHDYPELYDIVQNTLDLNTLMLYNPNAFSYDIGIVGVRKEDWAAFFAKCVREIFDNFKTSAT